MNRYERQKQASRDAILDAALLTFKERGYHAASVEDIITRGKVSRATFYKHFKSKLSLAEALTEQMQSREDAAFDQLGSIESPDFPSIVSWLYTLFEINEQNKLLLDVLAEFFNVEPKLAAVAVTANTNRIRKLSKSIPAFRDALMDSERGSEARDRTQLLLYEIDSIVFRVVVRGWQIDRKVVAHFLARQIQNFIAGVNSDPSDEGTHLSSATQSSARPGSENRLPTPRSRVDIDV